MVGCKSAMVYNGRKPKIKPIPNNESHVDDLNGNWVL